MIEERFGDALVDVGPAGSAIMRLSLSARQIMDRHGRRADAVAVFSDVPSHSETVRPRERFVVEASHELRTAPKSVSGYVELAGRTRPWTGRPQRSSTSPTATPTSCC